MDIQIWIKEIIDSIPADKRLTYTLLVSIIGLLISIVGIFLAVINFVYTWRKDRRLKKMEKLEKSPSFDFCNFQIDAVTKYDGYANPIGYSYDSEERVPLRSLLDIKNSIPDDYPEYKTIGMVIKNIGSAIRFFKIQCEEEYDFQRYKSEGDCYVFRYRFRRSDIGKPLKFKLQFETEAGLNGTQTWLIKKGSPTIQRIKPKSV